MQRVAFRRDASPSGGFLGGGFLLLRGLAVTAAHCVNNDSIEDIRLHIYDSGNELVIGGVFSLCQEKDIAYFRISSSLLDLSPFVPRRESRVNVDDRWRVLPPSEEYKFIDGSVVAPENVIRTVGGASVASLQLFCRQGDGRYDGYSGSPVRIGDSDSSPVAGMLIAASPDRRNPEFDSDTLHGVLLSEMDSGEVLSEMIADGLGIKAGESNSVTSPDLTEARLKDLYVYRKRRLITKKTLSTMQIELLRVVYALERKADHAARRNS